MKCPLCKKEKDINKHGKFRCTNCNTLFEYKYGNYEIKKHGKYRYYVLIKLLIAIALAIFVGINLIGDSRFFLYVGLILLCFPILYIITSMKTSYVIENYDFEFNLYSYFFNKKMGFMDDLTKWSFYGYIVLNITGAVFLLTFLVIKLLHPT